MTSYTCKLREKKSKLIFSLVNRRQLTMLQTEIVKLGRAVIGKMARSVFHVSYGKETGIQIEIFLG